jgi:hypothetical protein
VQYRRFQESRRQYDQSGGAQGGALDDKEIDEWRTAFPYLRVTGFGLKLAQCAKEEQNVEANEEDPSSSSHISEETHPYYADTCIDLDSEDVGSLCVTGHAIKLGVRISDEAQRYSEMMIYGFVYSSTRQAHLWSISLQSLCLRNYSVIAEQALRNHAQSLRNHCTIDL